MNNAMNSTDLAAAGSSRSDVNLDVDKNEEKIINWQEEATAIVNDVKAHVQEINISKVLPCDENNIYLNITTIENERYCVHASVRGFQIVASGAYDTIDEEKSMIIQPTTDDVTQVDGVDSTPDVEVFETPYALLDKISPRYVESFGNQLCKQLLLLQQMRTQFNEEDEEGIEEDDELDGDISTGKAKKDS